MKKIIRLTESDLHNLVQRSVVRILQEDNSFLLQLIAQSIIQQKQLDVNVGENDGEFRLQGDKFAYITFEVDCDPYMQQGMRSSSYDVPNDPDKIIDKPTVVVNSIDYCDGEGECIQIHDNGLVKQALEKIINVDYTNYDVPTEGDYFNEY